MVSYTPHDWRPGEIVTDDDMDRIEVGISDMSAPTQATVTQIITDTGGAAYAAIQDVAAARLARYSRLATDFGVKLDSTADQTDKMQAALDAAAGDGFDLLLPASTIVCEGGLSWVAHKHAIIAPQGSVLDFSGMTSGTAITLDGSRLTGQQGPVVLPGELHGVILKGPTGASTVDGILYESGHPSNNSVYGVNLSRVVVLGFRHPETYGDNTWLIHHRDYYTSKWTGDAIHWTGTTNCGENIRYDGGCFSNGANVVNVPVYAGINMSFAGTSFDYNTAPVVTAKSGVYTFQGCHFEYGALPGNTIDHMPVAFDLTSDTTSSTTPTLTIQGGELLTQGTADENTTGENTVVKTTTTGGNMPPVVVTSEGLTVHSRASGAGFGLLTFHRETNIEPDQEWVHGYPQIRFVGNLNYRGGVSYARMGKWTSIIRDGEMSSTGAWPTSWAFADGPSVGWCALNSNVTRDTTEAPTGSTASAKHAFASAAPGGQLLTQPFTVTQRTFLHIGFQVKTDGWTAGSVCGMFAKFYDPTGADITEAEGVVSLTGLPTDSDWTWHGGWIQVPRGATVGSIYTRLNGSTGTMWVSDVTVSAL